MAIAFSFIDSYNNIARLFLFLWLRTEQRSDNRRQSSLWHYNAKQIKCQEDLLWKICSEEINFDDVKLFISLKLLGDVFSFLYLLPASTTGLLFANESCNWMEPSER